MKSTIAISSLILACSMPASAAEPFELKDGDKVVWLGSTLIEREQRYGYWETALTSRWPDRKITFRNLGWSGDNVFGEARLAFDINTPALGLKRMVDLTLAEKPTVIFICYGTNESFEGEAGLEKFEKGYEKLLDALAPSKARIVLMTPPPFQLTGSTNSPESKKRNGPLELYCIAIEKIAKKRDLYTVDLFFYIMSQTVEPDFTDNGMHLSKEGYEFTADYLGERIASDENPEMAKLRQAIIAKNQLYFYRWRPQNETYLFGFRKHEQGKNAKEVAEFDPLIAKVEAEIDKLKKPKTHRYELVPAEKKK